jgi:hypothetical protein
MSKGLSIFVIYRGTQIWQQQREIEGEDQVSGCEYVSFVVYTALDEKA